MRFQTTRLPGVHVIEVEAIHDERGYFARTWCADEFAAHGVNPRCVQCSIASNARRGTLRGMHYQAAPSEETRLVRVLQGAVHDVVVDLRSELPTFGQWFSVELSASNQRSVCVPEGCAHGYLTLEDDTVLHYQMSAAYDPQAVRGFRWDDPALAGAWPFEPVCISERDRGLPALTAVPR